MRKNPPDRVSGLFWVALSVFVCTEAAQSGLGQLSNPGPGFLPFCSSLVMGVFGVSLIATHLFRGQAEGRILDLWRRVEWKRVVWTLASLFLYALLLPRLGYVPATFGLFLCLFWIMKRTLWVQEVVSALAIACLSYFLFRSLMGIQLPEGLMSFFL